MIYSSQLVSKVIHAFQKSESYTLSIYDCIKNDLTSLLWTRVFVELELLNLLVTSKGKRFLAIWRKKIPPINSKNILCISHIYHFSSMPFQWPKKELYGQPWSSALCICFRLYWLITLKLGVVLNFAISCESIKWSLLILADISTYSKVEILFVLALCF